jgi:hypothetical protein
MNNKRKKKKKKKKTSMNVQGQAANAQSQLCPWES